MILKLKSSTVRLLTVDVSIIFSSNLFGILSGMDQLMVMCMCMRKRRSVSCPPTDEMSEFNKIFQASLQPYIQFFHYCAMHIHNKQI